MGEIQKSLFDLHYPGIRPFSPSSLYFLSQTKIVFLPNFKLSDTALGETLHLILVELQGVEVSPVLFFLFFLHQDPLGYY
ncbi:hypothetical protein G436_2035 [Leptospira interrogans serovar Hardjo str. Norma]|uniref:Uncharacterized protein n=1 Tax=Leptospira interrogans serovar Hardjo str. Norma TaxID=1279460 RepID=A0A0M4N8I6_LEPIR|nr:hypothetical protein G436_2035 [Leptospira interrogans serovar Hardjo str. Norma]